MRGKDEEIGASEWERSVVAIPMSIEIVDGDGDALFSLLGWAWAWRWKSWEMLL
jgi:hypothetical protein